MTYASGWRDFTRKAGAAALPTSESMRYPPCVLEHVPCDLCGADDARVVTVEAGLDIRRCRRCGLRFVSPRPVRAIDEDALWFTAVEEADFIRATYRDVYAWGLDRVGVGRAHAGARLLDVGCGWGIFMKLAEERGFEAHGVDVSTMTTQHARDTLGLARVRTGELRAEAYPRGHFDVVTMWNLLEHVAAPSQLLSIVRALLAPGGALVVRVPNMDFYEVMRAAGRVSKRFARVPHLAAPPPGHLYGFDARTLRAILERAGFAVDDVVASPLSAMHPRALRLATRASTRLLARATRGRLNVSPAIVAFARGTA